MGKITGRQIAAAFKAGRCKTLKNTKTDGSRVTLFGHDIAWTDEQGTVWLDTCGYSTVTTHDRLNAICDTFEADFRFCQKKNEQYLWYWKTQELVPYDGPVPLVGPLGRLALAA